MSHDTLNTVLNIISIVLHLVQIAVGAGFIVLLNRLMDRHVEHIEFADKLLHEIKTVLHDFKAENIAGREAAAKRVIDALRKD